MPASIAIRLGVEGSAEVKRALEDTGRAGETAFRQVGAAADASGAATDRQLARYQKLAQAAREAEAAARAQASVNATLGVRDASSGSARASAEVFEAASREAAQAAAAEQERRSAQAAQAAAQASRSQQAINAVLGVRDPVQGSARSSAEAFEAAAREAGEMERRVSALRAAIDPLGASQAKANAAIREADDLFKRGEISASEHAKAIGVATQKHEEYAKSLRASNDNTARPGGLAGYQVTNLRSQAFDVFTSLQGGISPVTVASQQGPQIYEALAGQTGLAGGLRAAGATISAFLTPARLAASGIAGIAAAGVAAYASFASGQRDLQTSLGGAARAAGNSREAINALVPAAAAAGGVSVREARSMASAFAATGQISDSIFGRLIAVTKDFAATTGQDVPEATTALAQALADPAKGFDLLAAKVGGMTAAQRESVRALAESGDKFGAQRALIDAVVPSLTKATENVGLLARAWQAVSTGASDAYDATGRVIARVIDGPSTAEQAEKARSFLRSLEQQNRTLAGNTGSPLLDGPLARAGSRIDTSVAQQAYQVANARKRAEEEASVLGADAFARASKSLMVDDFVKSMNPAQERLRAIEAQATKIRDALKSGTVDEDGRAHRALEGLNAQAAQLRKDMAAGGSEFAEALRASQFTSRTSGFTPSAAAAAEAERQAEERRKRADLGPAGERDAALKASDEILKTDLARIRTEALRAEAQVGGAFSRLSPDLQNRVQAAANDYGRVPAGLIAAVIGKESSGNTAVGFSKSLGEDGRPSSAFGLGQITTGAEKDIRANRLPGFDRMDPSQQVAGVAAYLDILIQRRGGDQAAAVGDYFGSKDPSKRAAYVAEVYRKMGQMGDASTLGQVKDLDANRQALESANENLRTSTRLYGENGQQLEAQTRLQEMLRSAQARGIPINDELRASFERSANGMAAANRALASSRAGKDLQFEADQLGRDRLDQSAYARARSIYGDTSTDEAQAFITKQRGVSEMSEARNTFSDVFGSVTSDLRRGADAATVASNAFGRFVDKILSSAIDKLAAGLFSGASSGDGGLLSGFAKLVTGSAPAAATGGLIRGPGSSTSDSILARLSDREYVMKADAVAHYGTTFMDTINGRALPRYRDGGSVGTRAYQSPIGSAPAPVVNVTNMAAGDGYTATAKTEPNGSVDVLIDRMDKALAGRQGAGRSAFGTTAGLAPRLRG